MGGMGVCGGAEDGENKGREGKERGWEGREGEEWKEAQRMLPPNMEGDLRMLEQDSLL